MQVLIRPVITEKSIKDSEKDRFTFAVLQQASKNQIKEVIEKQFGVHVLDIATTIQKGKTKRTGKRFVTVAIPAFKKAIVTVKKGEKIDLFSMAA